MISGTGTLDDPVRYYGRYGPTGLAEQAASRSAHAPRAGGGADSPGEPVRAVRSCHDARRDRLAALADDLLDCYTAGRGDGAAKRALVDFVTAEVIEQITMEDEAFRPLAATPVGAGIIDALPAGPPLIRALVQEIADDRSDVTVAAATGALVMLMDARAAVENAVLLPALDKSPERVGTLDTLLSCCDQSTVVCQNRSEWWIG